MTRVLLLFVAPLIVPTIVFVIWRTFAPPKLGGSEALAKDQWEPLPWPWLLGCGAALVAITLGSMFLFPAAFEGL